jgi:cell wall-associated NlpC family hydrolase
MEFQKKQIYRNITSTSWALLLALAPTFLFANSSGESPSKSNPRYMLPDSSSSALMEILKADRCLEIDEKFFESLRSFVRIVGRMPSESELKTLPPHIAKAISIANEVIVQSKIGTNEVFKITSSLTSLDVGDQTTELLRNYHDKVQNTLKEGTSKTLSRQTCYPAQKQAPSTTPLPELLNRYAQWSLATAYQSCQAPEIVVRKTTGFVDGIKIVGMHPDGVGLKRVIGDLNRVQQTHPYIQSTYDQQCIAVKESPLIYDYGGKPYFTEGVRSPIDFFKNNGDGTEVLGIDCSGFVFSIFATSGLKLKSTRQLKASDSVAWSSRAYVDPAPNGIDCLAPITVTSTNQLQAGDVVAIPGHVFIVDQVGEDPFGVKRAKSLEDCAHLSAENFNFTIIQSSNSLDGVGINRFFAADYLKDHKKFGPGMEEYARNACEAYLLEKPLQPKVQNLTITRHKGTPACRADRIPLAGESCISQCPIFKN